MPTCPVSKCEHSNEFVPYARSLTGRLPNIMSSNQVSEQTEQLAAKKAASKKLKSQLLADFYGKPAEDDAQKPLQLSDPLDIDGNTFEAKSYYSALLKTKNLANLMTIDVELKKEIRKFDSELKMLVYENYNRFISATDTIRKVTPKSRCFDPHI